MVAESMTFLLKSCFESFFQPFPSGDYRFVHLDFKGAPPKVPFLEKVVFPTLSF